MTKADADDAVNEGWRGAKAWVLENPRRVKPVPVKGQQGNLQRGATG